MADFGKEIYTNVHYNKRKEQYKTIEIRMVESGILFSIREGIKNDKGSVKNVVISLSPAEALHIAKVLEEWAKYEIRKSMVRDEE